MPKKTVYLFVFETLADCECGYAVAGISNPQFQKNANCYKVATVGASTDAIRTIGGVRIIPDIAIENVSLPDSACSSCQVARLGATAKTAKRRNWPPNS